MADRRTVLEEAFKADEEETKDSPGDSDETPGDEPGADDTAGAAGDDKPLLGTGDDAAAPADTSGEEKTEKAPGKDAKGGVPKGGAKPLPGSDPSRPAKSDVQGAPKTLEQTEKEAAEAGEPPRAWKVTAREHWAKLPKEAREEIQRRETEITQFIGKHGAAIQHKAQFDEMVQPFMPFIAAQQSTPMKAFHGLMTTAARLTTGSPVQKARVIQEIMNNYGIDVKTLDEVLSSSVKPGSNGVPHSEPAHAERPPAWAQPLLSFMTETQRERATREKAAHDAAAAELAEFEKKPFFSDLEADIGILMERAAKKGQLMSIQQAYDKARKMNPEVDQILTQREKAAAARTTGSPVTRARAAASTVKGSPSSGTVTAPKKDDAPKDRRTILQEAIDASRDD